MTTSFSLTCPSFATYDRLSKKPSFFNSLPKLKIKEFDDIYDEQMVKRCGKHEIRRLCKRKDRERPIGAGRYFKLDVKRGFSCFWSTYVLYIAYTLDGFLFALDHSNICRDMLKNEPLVRACVHFAKMYKLATQWARWPCSTS